VSVGHAEGKLADYHYVALILRLVLDSHGHLAHGELLDSNAETLSHFRGKRGLTRVIEERLKDYEEQASAQRAEGTSAEGDTEGEQF
jgi:hypothetical protein